MDKRVRIQVQADTTQFQEKMKIVTGSIHGATESLKDFEKNIKHATVGELQGLQDSLKAPIEEQTKMLENAKKALDNNGKNLRASVATELQNAHDQIANNLSSMQEKVTATQRAIDKMRMPKDDTPQITKGWQNVINAVKGFRQRLEDASKSGEKLRSRLGMMVISSTVYKAISYLQRGLQNATKLSEGATNGFTAIGNVFTGILIPVVEFFAQKIMKAFIWIGGLIKYLTGFDIVTKGIQATNKSIAQLGKNAKKSGKQVKDGLLSGLDEITNIDQGDDSSGGGGLDTNLLGQVGAMTSLKDAMAQMDALDFSWAEPIKNVFTFLGEHMGFIVALIKSAVLVFSALAIMLGAVNLWFGVLAINPVPIMIGALIVLIALLIDNWDELKAFVTEVIDKISAKIREWVTNVQTWFNNIVQFARDAFEGIMNFGKSCVDSVVGFFVWLGTSIGNVFTNAWNFVTGIFGGLGAWFGGIITDVVEWFKSLPSKISTAVGKMYNTVIEWFDDIGATIGKTISGYISSAINGVIKGAYNVINSFIRKINGVIEFVNKIPGVNLTKMNLLEIPKFDVGTNYVPHDMIAQIHKGERIVPKKYNHKDFENQAVDMGPTNALLMELINTLERKNMGISKDAIGKASVEYIRTESRRKGALII